MNVDAMLAEISIAQFVEWQIFASLDPFDEGRADLRAALVAATVANVQRPRGKQPLKVDDFLLRFEKETQAAGVTNVEKMKQMLTAFTLQWNASRKPTQV